jgi:hypothetical protein
MNSQVAGSASNLKNKGTSPNGRILGCALLVGASAMPALYAGQTDAPRSPRELLRAAVRVDDGEWAAIERGEPIAKVLDTDTREIAVAGAIRIGASSDRLVARFRDIGHLKRSDLVLDAGRFGPDSRPADLASVPFEEYDLDLRSCRPFDCRVRLSESDIARFHREVDWRAPSWRERSAAIWREVLAGYAASYARSGRTALPVYANKREPLSVASEVSEIVEEFGFVADVSPELRAYMREFRPSSLPGAEHTLYWSKEDFGVRPILRISHQVIYRIPQRPPAVAVATNQIYADHYLDAALTVTLAIETDVDGQGPRFYMISMSRARTRSLTGFMRSFVRSIVQSRSREALRKILTSTKVSLEGAATGSPR